MPAPAVASSPCGGFRLALLLLLPVLHSHALLASPMLATQAPQVYPREVPGAIAKAITPAPPPATQAVQPVSKHPANATSHAKPKKAFPVLAIEYKRIRDPFEIALWILLACLMKLGTLGASCGPARGAWSLGRLQCSGVGVDGAA